MLITLAKGYGVLNETSGKHYEGEWTGNLKHGKGKESLPNVYTYEGSFANGTFNGLGTFTSSGVNFINILWAPIFCIRVIYAAFI
jgi:hypothetical protein